MLVMFNGNIRFFGNPIDLFFVEMVLLVLLIITFIIFNVNYNQLNSHIEIAYWYC